MEQIFNAINRMIESLLIFIFGLLVLDVLWQVFSRYVLNQSFSFTEELARFALIWLSILGAAYLNGQQAHLSMDFLLQKLTLEKRVQRIKIIEGSMFLFALVVMVIGGGNLTYTTLYLGQVSPAMNISLGYIYAIVPFSGLLIMFYSVYHILHANESTALKEN
ncbi:MAG: TRAP transporter small permease [Bacteroidota bacterium]